MGPYSSSRKLEDGSRILQAGFPSFLGLWVGRELTSSLLASTVVWSPNLEPRYTPVSTVYHVRAESTYFKLDSKELAG